jgi:hypothetical protein
MEIACSAKTVITTYKSTRFHNSEDHNINYYRVRILFCVEQ